MPGNFRRRAQAKPGGGVPYQLIIYRLCRAGKVNLIIFSRIYGGQRKKNAPTPASEPAHYRAQRVGFEPTVPSLVHLISSQGRYNHFDTAAWERTSVGQTLTDIYNHSVLARVCQGLFSDFTRAKWSLLRRKRGTEISFAHNHTDPLHPCAPAPPNHGFNLQKMKGFAGASALSR